MLDVLPPAIIYSGFTSNVNTAIHVAEEYFPGTKKEIFDAQAAKAAKRIGNVNKRIADLQTKKKELLKEAKPPVKKAPNKK